MKHEVIQYVLATQLPVSVVRDLGVYLDADLSTGCPLFFNIDFPQLFHDQKMNIHDLSAQHIFPSKRYTTYECIPELVVTVPSAHSTIVKKIKRFINEVVSLVQTCSVQ